MTTTQTPVELTWAEMQQAGGGQKSPSGVRVKIPITVKHNL